MDEPAEVDLFDDDSEYAPVGIPWSWGVLAFALLAVLLVMHLFDLGGLFTRVRATGILLLAGLVAGAIGLRFDARKTTARYAVVVHGALLALILLPLVFFYLTRVALR